MLSGISIAMLAKRTNQYLFKVNEDRELFYKSLSVLQIYLHVKIAVAVLHCICYIQPFDLIICSIFINYVQSYLLKA